MSYKTILVNLNEILQVERLLTATAAIARKSDAYVIGLYVIPAPDLILSSGLEALPIEDDLQRAMFKNHEKAVGAAFEAAILKDGIRGEFLVAETADPNITSTVIGHSHRADLVVIGHSGPASSRAMGARFSEIVAVSSGRPTLVVPPNERTVLSSSLAMIGWNGSREAARAAFDSIPLLQQTGEVLLAVVGPRSKDAAPSNLAISGAGMVATLGRHGINVRLIEYMSGEEPGEVLLDRAEGRCADLLVVGAYGHSRLNEFLLGGATRSILKRMQCPVLFSH